MMKWEWGDEALQVARGELDQHRQPRSCSLTQHHSITLWLSISLMLEHHATRVMLGWITRHWAGGVGNPSGTFQSHPWGGMPGSAGWGGCSCAAGHVGGPLPAP